MATTVPKAFDEFAARIALSSTQQQTVQDRKDTVVGYLRAAFPSDSDMPLDTTKLMGSAGRNTIIRPLNDIDMMATFSNVRHAWDKYENDSQAFLYRIRKALNNSTTVSKIGARGQAVRFFYTDGIHVDVAPMFRYQSGSYGLPDGSGSWLTTNPDEHQAYIDRRHAELGNNLKPLIKKLKCWNRVHSGRLGSFHLEVMTASTFGSLNNDSRDATHKFFLWAQSNLSVKDPADHSKDLSSFMSSVQKIQVIQSFSAAAQHASAALTAESAGNPAEAIRQWRVVFGDEFPAYG